MFFWENGRETDLGPMIDACLNNRGQVLGTKKIGDEFHLVMWDAGRMTDLNRHGLNGRIEVVGYHLNDRGQIVGVCDMKREGGRATWKSFLWEDGRTTFLDERFRPFRINNRGQIVGSRDTDRPNQPRESVLWQTGSLRRLERPPGRPWGHAFGLNEQGDVVGACSVEMLKNMRAMLWRDGKPVDLNETIPVGSGWTLHEALDINDRGQIVGWGSLGGESHAFLLTPRQ
jgi:uncharacterized membrane protein